MTATKPMELGVQLYTLGPDVGEDLEGILREVAAIGYRKVELPRVYGHDPASVAQTLAAFGLSCPSFHVGLDPLFPDMPSLADPAPVIEIAKALGAEHMVVPVFPFPPEAADGMREGEAPIDFVGRLGRGMTVEQWQRIAERLNEAGKVLDQHGLKLDYHNHHVEFFRLTDGRTPLELLLAETDPALVGFELDIGWALMEGFDPVALLEQHKDRIRQVHLRDLRRMPEGSAAALEWTDIGTGVMPWRDVLPAIERAGVEHMYVEQDPPFAASRLDAIRQAFNYLSGAMAAE